MKYKTTEEIKKAFKEAGWNNPDFKIMTEKEIKATFGELFNPGLLFVMIGSGTIYDTRGRVVAYNLKGGLV